MGRLEEGDLRFRDRGSWRNWLRRNHDVSDGVWLILRKKGADIEGVTYEEALDEALCFGWIDSRLERIDDRIHRQRFTPRRKGSIWSKANVKRVERLTAEGLMTDAGSEKVREAKRNGRWEEAYESRIPSHRMPKDLEGALAADPKARKNFSSFAESYRRNYIAWVVGAKTEATRGKRVAKVVELAAKGQKSYMG
jgi:uncharacterized protein YdeI (YjbR/CyaY-like superfamily)